MLKLSASSIGTYEKCPKQYHYRYIEKPKIEEKSWAHLEFGSCAHKILELFHIELIKNPRPVSEYHLIMKQCASKAIKEFNMDVLRPELPTLNAVIQDYLNSVNSGVPEVIAVEKNFTLAVDNYTLRGYIDRVDRVAPATYKVVDYKTNNNPKYLTDFQLRVYALAVKQMYPDAEHISGSYILLKHKSQTKDWDFSPSDLDKCYGKIQKAGNLISTDEVWVKKPTKLCDWCDFRDICLPVDVWA